jgi:hypothetical protein
LEYCSVEAWIKFRAELKSAKTTELNIEDLDRSEVGEFEIGSQVSSQREENKSEVGSHASSRLGSKEHIDLPRPTPKFN